MNNIFVIYNKENNDIVKLKRYILPLSIILIFFSFYMIIPINRIIFNAKINGNIDYNFLNIFIFVTYNILLFISTLISIYYNYRSINVDIKDMKIENLLNTNIKFSDIVFGKYLNSVKYSLSIILPIFPIFYLTFLFGGFHLFFMIKFIFIIIVSVLFFSALSIFISSRYTEPVVSFIISFILSVFYLIINIIFFNMIYNDLSIYFMFLIFLIIMAILFVFLTIKTKLYK